MTEKKTNGLSGLVVKTRAALRAEIEEGRFADVERLPGERDLASALSVSRTTIRKAIAELIASGRLYQRHGFGTYVSRAPQDGRRSSTAMRPAAVDVTQAFDHMVHLGEACRLGPTRVSIAAPSPDEAINLRLAATDRIWRKTCSIAMEDQVVAIETTVVPVGFLHADGQMDDRRMIVETGGQPVARISQHIRAVTFDRQTTAALCNVENTNGFYIDRALILADRRCIAFRRVACRAALLDCLHDIAVDAVNIGSGGRMGEPSIDPADA